jgi:hypothetical protein
MRQIRAGTLGIWVFSLYLPLTFLLLDKNDVSFDYRVYTCVYKFSSESWRWLKVVSAVILGLVPTLITITATVMQVCYLRKARTVSKQCQGLIRSQGIVTVILTAVIYTVSVLPYTMYQLLEPFFDISSSSETEFHTQYYRVASCLLLLNLLTNFFVCSMTVKSFRSFLWERGHRISDLYRPCNVSGSFSGVRVGIENIVHIDQ